MANTFYERPILNSPYEKPRFHHPLDEHGQPLGLPPVEARRHPKPTAGPSTDLSKLNRL